jgi:hypothetical protein
LVKRFLCLPTPCGLQCGQELLLSLPSACAEVMASMTYILSLL